MNLLRIVKFTARTRARARCNFILPQFYNYVHIFRPRKVREKRAAPSAPHRCLSIARALRPSHVRQIPPRITARFLTCREFLLLQTELSQNLQQLSERARSTTEFIQRLKGMTDKVHVSTRAFGVLFKFRVGGYVTPSGTVKIARRYGVNYINLPRDGSAGTDLSLMAEGIIRKHKGHRNGLRPVNKAR